MKLSDLEKMSLAELREIHRTVGKAILTFEDRRRKEALADLEVRARELGFTVSELVAGKGRRSKSALEGNAVRYFNPENPQQTWTGRGRKPKWYWDGIASGKSDADFAV